MQQVSSEHLCCLCRFGLPLSSMAGVFDSTIYGRTPEGAVGTAGRWPSRARVAGIATHFAVQQSALAISNVVFGASYSQPLPAVLAPSLLPALQDTALEACGKCWSFQVGNKAEAGDGTGSRLMHHASWFCRS